MKTIAFSYVGGLVCHAFEAAGCDDGLYGPFYCRHFIDHLIKEAFEDGYIELIRRIVHPADICGLLDTLLDEGFDHHIEHIHRCLGKLLQSGVREQRRMGAEKCGSFRHIDRLVGDSLRIDGYSHATHDEAQVACHRLVEGH